MASFRDMQHVKNANRDAGQFFFSPESLEFFNSEVGRDLFHGHYFITSETPDESTPRRFTVRFARTDGKIRELGTFREHETEDAARVALENHFLRNSRRGHVPDSLFP